MTWCSRTRPLKQTEASVQRGCADRRWHRSLTLPVAQVASTIFRTCFILGPPRGVRRVAFFTAVSTSVLAPTICFNEATPLASLLLMEGAACFVFPGTAAGAAAVGLNDSAKAVCGALAVPGAGGDTTAATGSESNPSELTTLVGDCADDGRPSVWSEGVCALPCAV